MPFLEMVLVWIMDYLQYFEPKKLGSKAYFVSLGYEAFRLAGFLEHLLR